MKKTSEMEIYYNNEQDPQQNHHDNEECHINAHFDDNVNYDLQRTPSENGQLQIQQTELTGPAVVTIEIDNDKNLTSE